MIIDEILNAKNNNNIIDIEYIKEEAELFDFDYITKAINKQNVNELKAALKEYILQNEYNKELLKDIDNLKINFNDPMECKK